MQVYYMLVFYHQDSATMSVDHHDFLCYR